MNILGISAFYHDSAACLVQDGKIISAAQEERFTRKKHDASFPTNAINYCLSNSGLKVEDINYVAFYDKPFLKFERILETYLAFAPKGISSFLKSMPVWIKEKLWMRQVIINELGYEGEAIFTEHHESHAASAFYPSPFQQAAVLTMDGVGEWSTASFGVGSGNDLKLIADLKFPHSLGLLYSAFTYYTGFKVNSAEYKVMGLAPYGEPKYKDTILSELIDLREDGSFRLRINYFDYCAGLRMVNKRFERLFGSRARAPESRITKREMDLARSIQEVTEEIVIRMARHAHRETGQKNLCMAGGVALNCVANGKLLKEGPFENIWIQPAAGDAGGALGAALFTWYKYLGNERSADGVNDSQRGSLLGPEFSKNEIKNFLGDKNIRHQELTEEELVKKTAELLNEGKVIGWFQGRMEFGPRALGARSILGDPRNPKMQEILNLKIKFRESFRPFAPMVLQEHCSEYFELDRESPYMLIVAPVRRELRTEFKDNYSEDLMERLKIQRSKIPAVTHLDFSARIQTVDKKRNPLLHKLLSEFYNKFGCPVLVNTSFNVRGEPIALSPKDAYRCFMRTNMDYLVLGNFLVGKDGQQQIGEDADWKKKFALD